MCTVCIRSYIYTYVDTYLHTHVRTYLQTYIHTYIRTYIHIYTCKVVNFISFIWTICTCRLLQTRSPILAFTTNSFARTLYVVKVKISARHYFQNERNVWFKRYYVYSNTKHSNCKESVLYMTSNLQCL